MSMFNDDPTVYMTRSGFVLPMVSGFISAISSVITIYAVYISSKSLNTTYHRIVAHMSCFTLISSVCYGLATLPMPKDIVYDFAGPRVGNFGTCQAQSFLLLFGSGGGASWNLGLRWYFVFSIVFKFERETITKFLEPIFHHHAIFF